MKNSFSDKSTLVRVLVEASNEKAKNEVLRYSLVPIGERSPDPTTVKIGSNFVIDMFVSKGDKIKLMDLPGVIRVENDSSLTVSKHAHGWIKS